MGGLSMGNADIGSGNFEAHNYLAPMQLAEKEETVRLQELTVAQLESELADLTRNSDPIGTEAPTTERRRMIQRINDELFVRSGCQPGNG